MSYEHQHQEDYEDRIPLHGYGSSMGGENASVMEMRWQSPDFILGLWRVLAGRVPVVINGEAYLVRENPTIQPPMNDIGASRIIQVVWGFVNPVVSLSNIGDDEAGLIYNKCMKAVVMALQLEQEHFGIRSIADMEIIVASITPILFCQIKRAVSGHESKQSKTQTQEIKQESFNTQRTSGGFSLNPFKSK